MILQGAILRILQEQAKDGFVMVLLQTQTGTVRASGAVPFAMPGEILSAQGMWEDSPDPDPVFRITSVSRNLPDSEPLVRAFLEDMMLRTLGRIALQRVVERYGGETLRVLLEDPLRLSEIPGLPADRALAASDELQFRLARRDAAQWMVQFGVSPARAEAAGKRYGREVVSWLQENPYRLLEPLLGGTFDEVDRAALAGGMAFHDRRRLEAAAEWALRRAQEEGHVCLPEPVLLRNMQRMLGEDPAALFVGMPSEDVPLGDVPEDSPTEMFCRAKDVAAFLDFGIILKGAKGAAALPDPACLVYTAPMLLLETHVARRLRALGTIGNGEVFQLTPSDWAALETLAPWGWDDLQRKVFADAGSHGVTVVTGGPGTGKTTLIKGLVRVFADRDLEVVLTAPTGRAARRMADATGLEAKTVHRLLEMAYDVDGTDTLRFRRGPQEPLDAEVVILDEASMLDLPLFAALLDACADGTRLILVGDAEQLPSVGAGRVLGDLIESGSIPVTRLGQVFRQMDGSRIAANAQAILEGRFPEFSDEWGEFHLVRRYRGSQVLDTVVRLCREELPERYGFDPLTDIQVLSPMRKGAAGTVKLNELLREALNPVQHNKAKPMHHNTRTPALHQHTYESSESSHQEALPFTRALPFAFREGDRVMQNRNEYRQSWVWQDAGKTPVPGEGVYNGDMGTLMELDTRTRSAVVLFDDGREARYDFRQLDGLEPAYAVTVHKSQGSEYPVVVLALGAMPDSLACRNLLYTAITRAKRMVVIVGSEETLARMIANNRNLTRYSGLSARLQGKMET